MNWFGKLLAAATGDAARRPAPEDDFWYAPANGLSGAGQRVTPQTAIQQATVYACVRVLSETMASLPLILYRRRRDGGKERFGTHPLALPLHDQPNDWQTSFRWREMLMAHLALRGNSYHYLADQRGNGYPSQIVPLHPDRVTVRQDPDTMRLSYEYRPLRGEKRTYVQEEVLHLRGLSDDGFVGMSPLAMQRETIGAALGAADYGARFFGNDARPGVVFKHPAKLGEEAYNRLKASIRQSWSGPNRHSPAVLEEGMEVHEMALTNKDSQFLEARNFSRQEIAAIYRLPPHMIGDLSRATFSNIEHQAIAFVRDTIRPWAVRIEQEINSHPALLGGQDDVFAEFLLDGLLRGDIASRYAAYSTGRQWGWLSVNDVRQMENMNPVDGGDVYLQPMNMVDATDGAGREDAPREGGRRLPPPASAQDEDDEDDSDDEENARGGRALTLEVVRDGTGTDGR